jgi:hypothetical protein
MPVNMCMHSINYCQWLCAAPQLVRHTATGHVERWRDQQEHVLNGRLFQPDQEIPDSKSNIRGHVEVGAVGGETSRSSAERSSVPA